MYHSNNSVTHKSVITNLTNRTNDSKSFNNVVRRTNIKTFMEFCDIKIPRPTWYNIFGNINYSKLMTQRAEKSIVGFNTNDKHLTSTALKFYIFVVKDLTKFNVLGAVNLY